MQKVYQQMNKEARKITKKRPSFGAKLLTFIIFCLTFPFALMWYDWVGFQNPIGYWKLVLFSVASLSIGFIANGCGLGWITKTAWSLVLITAIVATVLYWTGFITLPLFHVAHH